MVLREVFSRTKPLWTYDAPHGWIVWKLLPTAKKSIVIEERETTEFQARLRLLDLQSGASRWSAVSPFDPWWSNLTVVSGDRAILEGYMSRDMPIAKGVAALNIDDGSLAWSDADAQLMEVLSDHVRVRKIQNGVARETLLTRTSGEPSSEPHIGSDAAKIQAIYPRDAVLDSFRELLPSEEVALLNGPIEVVELGRYTIVAYHVQNPRDSTDLMHQTFRSTILVARDGRRIWRETLAAQSPFPVAGNFVVLYDILIYVQEKSRITAVSLS